MFSFEELFAGDVDAIADRIAEQHLEKLFLTKNTEWESEREYRFIVRSPAEYEYVDVSNALVAVCRGPESARESEHALRYFANEFGGSDRLRRVGSQRAEAPRSPTQALRAALRLPCG
jgi:hypothetical protein